ncbi:MAG: LamG domain-containing protein [Verrucomicrobiota bacterium]|jgi:hypothetical protein
MRRISISTSEFIFKSLGAVSLLVAAQVANATLTHQYSFNDDPTSTNAIDSVGGATGALYPGATYPGDGTVSLDGASGFVYLPDDIVSNYTSITYEIWTTPNTEPTWARLFDFGTNQGGKGTGGVGGTGGDGITWDYLCFSDGTGLFHGDLESLTKGESIIYGPSPTAGVYHHIVFTIDAVAQTAALYDNGVQVSYLTNFTVTPQAVGHTYNDYIGRSQWPDPYYNGSIDEFRIYNNAVTPIQVEADYEAGADSTNGSAGSLASIQFNNASAAIVGGKFVPSILATYASLTNSVNITTVPGITYSSDNTNVLAYESDGYFHAISVGSTTIRASFQSQTAALAVTVNAQPAVLLHRYSFNGAAGSTTITDSVGGANGTLVNPTATSTLTGSGQLALDGNVSSAYVSLPAGLLNPLTNATFQVWVINNDPNADWAELWAFGTNNGSQGISYITLIPHNPTTGKLRLDDHVATIDAPESLPLSNEVCVTVNYNLSAQTASIYLGGRQVASGTMTLPLYSILDADNYLGQSQWYGSGDPYFMGILDEFRIYSGVKSDLQIAIDAVTGPNTIVTNPGALGSLSVVVSTTNVDVHGIGLPIQVLANFANVTGVDVTTLSQTALTVGNPSVGTIANGNFVPKNVGVSTVTATYGGVSGSVALTVVDTNAWPSLLHRWTFNDAPGSTTIADSVGSINGTLHGPLTLTNGEMITPSPNPVSASDGVPTASSGWVSFPGGDGLVTTLPNEASFEIWVVWNGGAIWQEMFDFGQAATPGFSLGGGQYVMICPYDGSTGALRAEWDQAPTYDITLTGPKLPIGVLCQVVWSHDQDRQLDRLYCNGQQVATAVNTALWSSLPDSDNWLARDEWQDPMFSGAYADFRIWNGALTAGQVANLYQAGPNVIVGPSLQISTSGHQITLQWPANASGFTLQSTTSLAGGSWTAVTTGTQTVVNGLNNLTLPQSQSQTYYRLKQ